MINGVRVRDSGVELSPTGMDRRGLPTPRPAASSPRRRHRSPSRPAVCANWDYRYCWLRDATFTLLALGSAGYYDEAREWQDWLLRAVAGHPDQLQIMYGLGAQRRLIEWEVPWLPGFDGARPVRVGNAAAAQLQLDVYGEIADAIFQARLHGVPAIEWATAIGRAFLDHLEAVWREPDEGIWEVRGPRQHSSRAASGSSTI
jgi:GH15 family glucan-1,4-alpha-glucosidase